MAFIDNQSITVDATLTKRERVASKHGNLNITSFALADDEIDYRLYNLIIQMEVNFMTLPLEILLYLSH